MSAERLALDDLIGSVADGTSELDWDALESVFEAEGDRRLVRQLRVLARISDVHRSHSDEPLVAGSAGVEGLDGDPGDPSARVIGRIEPRAQPPDAPHSPPEPDLPAPAMWGHLRLFEPVGQGTYGSVYRAFDTQLHREIAVKLLRVKPDAGELTERLLHEGRALARVRHTNVVVVHGAEARDGRVGLWMEFIRGATLESLLQTQGPFSAREAAVLGQDLCRAVAAVHAAGLVHRDIKAQNVMREAGGRVVLMDFGAGQLRDRITRGTGRVTGTPMYLAPELLNGAEATVGTDIYSVGVLLYRLVTRDFPVYAESIDALRKAHADGRRAGLRDARPDLPDWFVSVVDRALAVNPRDRFASAGALQSALGGALGGTTDSVTVSARPERSVEAAASPDAAARVARWRRSPWAAVAALVGVAALAAVGWWARTPPVSSPVATSAPVIAIMPFDRDVGVGDHAVHDLRRRMADALGRIAGVRVVAEASSLALKSSGAGGGARPPERPLTAAIGDGQAIDVVLDGQIRQTDPADVVVRLSRAGAVTPMWSGTLQGSPADVVARVVERVAASLNVPRSGGSPPAARVESAQVVDLVARGRYALERGLRERTEAINLLNHAVLLDPGHARAHAALARAYWEPGCLAQASEARASAEAAIALDAGLAEPHTILGEILFRCEWDWDAARSHYAAAIAANPSDEFSRRRYGMFLAARGDPSGGLVQMTHARDLDRLSATARTSTATLLLYNRRYADADREVQVALQLDPKLPAAHVVHGRVLMVLGRFVEASRAFAVAAALDTPAGQQNIRAEIAAADAAAGLTAQARRALRALEAQQRAEPARAIYPEILAFAYARLGDRDRAFQLLQEGFEQRSEGAVWLGVDPRSELLRSDSRYAAVLKRLDLDLR